MTRTPSPSPAELPNDGHTIFAALRDTLADLYADETSARVVVADAGLDAKHIAFSARAQSNWHNILTEAAHQKRLDVLLAIVYAAYASYPKLKDAYTHYTLFIQHGGDLTIATSLTEAPTPGEPPYKGLSFFEVTDAHLYFGRQPLVNDLVGMLTTISQGNHRFLAVIGASGSGKSSLVRAGLVPALNNDAVPGSDRWLIKIVTPTAQPVKELATVLTEREPDRATLELIDDLTADDRVLDVRASKILMHNARTSSRLLLIVDQFEELFTLCKDRTTRRAYISNLLTAAQSDGPTIVILTLRADFYRNCLEYEQLRLLLEQHTKLVGPMSREQLREAIVGPAVANGWYFEEGLVELFLDDVGDEPGALPLLAHALRETWERRRGHTLTLAGYSDVGRVQGAIGTTADRIFARLNDVQKLVAKSIFLRLTELGEGAEDTRRRARFAELLPTGKDRQSAEQVLQILADARLITTHTDEAEVAHEALIREWPQLRQWLDNDREGLRIHRRLTEAAKEWSAGRQDPSDLYRGSRLSQAQEWSAEHANILTAQEIAFLQASQVETEAMQKRQHRFTQLLVATVVITLIAAGVAWLQSWRIDQVNTQLTTNLAETQRVAQVALSRQLAAQSINESNNSRDELAILLALESGRATDTREAFSAIRAVLPTPRYHRTILWGSADGVLNVKWSRDGKKILAGSNDGVVYVWDATTGKAFLKLIGHQDAVTWVIWSQDERKILSLSADKTVRIWDAASGQQLARLEGHTESIENVLWNQDESKVLTSGFDGTARIWDSTTGKELFKLSHAKRVNQATWNADGSKVLTSSDDSIAYVWDAASGQKLIQFEGLAAWSADGSKILTYGIDRSVRLWDTNTGKELGELADSQNILYSPVWSPDKNKILAATIDRRTRIWDANTGEVLVTFREGIDHTNEPTWSPDGSKVLTYDNEGPLYIWDASSGQELTKLMGHVGKVWETVWNTDERKILTYSLDGTVRIWDVVTGKELVKLTSSIGYAAWHLDENKILTVSGDGGVRIWNLQEPLEQSQAEIMITDRVGFWSHDERKLATTSEDGTAHIWNATTGNKLFTLSGHTDVIGKENWSSDDTKLLTDSTDGTVHVWDAMTGKELISVIGSYGVWSHDDTKFLTSDSNNEIIRVWDATTGKKLITVSGNSATWSHDDTKILTDSTNGAMHLWDVTTGKEAARLVGHTAPVWERTLSSDDAKILTRSLDETVRIWDAVTGKELVKLRDHIPSLSLVIWNTDGSKVLTSGLDGSISIWDATTGKALVKYLGHIAWIRDASWNDDESKLLTASEDGIARIWDATTGKELVTLIGHTGAILKATWSTDGTKVLTSSDDRTARIWDATTGQELVKLEGVRWAEWNTDGSKILGMSTDDHIHIWYVHMSALLPAVCTWVLRNLTQIEWEMYMLGHYRPTCPNTPIPPDAIAGIVSGARTQIQAGSIISGTQRLEQLNSWLKENGQFENYGVDVSMFVAQTAATATPETTPP